jgi:carbonyl reductase 1
VAVVTGANKGIGYALVKRLAEMGLTVILTARDFERGSKAAHALRAQGLIHVHFFPLDVSDPASINAFVSFFNINFGSLDILVSIYIYIYTNTRTYIYTCMCTIYIYNISQLK